MIETDQNRINRISGINDKKPQIISPYILQLKSFEERAKNNKIKQNSCNFISKKPTQIFSQKEILNIAKGNVQPQQLFAEFFDINKENSIQPDIEAQRKLQVSLLTKVRQKIIGKKILKVQQRMFYFNEPKTKQTLTTQGRSRAYSDVSVVSRDMKLRNFTNNVSFLKYKKNKNLYAARLQ